MRFQIKYENLIQSKEEKKVRNICNNLNKTVEHIMGIDSQLGYFGSKEEGHYTICNKEDMYRVHNDKIFAFRMEIHYPCKTNFIIDNEIAILKTEEDCIKYIERKYSKTRLLYAEIMEIYVQPQRMGFGSEIINEVINSLKIIKSIEKIILSCQDENAKRFWIKNNFIRLSSSNEMVYIL